MNTMQAQVELKGLEIFRLMPRESYRFTDRRWWSGRLMELAMSDPQLKVRMFRFIDVMPTLTNSDLMAEHVREYFLSGDVRLPPFVQKILEATTSPVTASLAAAAIKSNVKAVATNFILDESPDKALPELKKIDASGRSFTVDILGEAALSKKESDNYLNTYLSLLDRLAREVPAWPAKRRREHFPVANISVKGSSLYARIGSVNYDDSVQQLKNRLRLIFQKGRETGAFINVDMENYSLKNITLDAFTGLLDEEEFQSWNGAGIAIQAYLKESLDDLAMLARWAAERGRKITVRIVKGAYWEYEQVVAKQKGWPVPVFLKKEHTDWHFERCVDFMLNNCRYITPAIATHNVRSIAYALVVAEKRGIAKDHFEFQMLRGMAEPVKVALERMGFPVREYVPMGSLVPGMAYLVRRLLENTSNESFLRRKFRENVPPAALLKAPKHYVPEAEPQSALLFANEPLHDLSRKNNRTAFVEALETVRRQLGQQAPLVIGGKEYDTGNEIISDNPARPEQIVGRASGLTPDFITLAVTEAVAAQREWGQWRVAERAEILFKAADMVRKRKLELAAWQIFETGKNWVEAEADVAEAIDYFEYYGREMLRLGDSSPLLSPAGERNIYRYRPRGVAVVIAPWNFPLAISAGMASAAMVAGNAVLYKPSSLSIMNGWQLCRIFQEAGVPPGIFNFVPGKGEVVGTALVEHPQVHITAFTGSRETGVEIIGRAARISPGQRHVKRVVAEMGGKNAIIVDADADLDQAVAGVIQSAFSYQGQKCSACSRVIVLAPCYHRFVERLIDAVGDITVGPPEDPAHFMGPLIEPRAVERLRRYLSLAGKEGRIAAIGRSPGHGYYFPPVVVTDLPSNSAILREEIFGPFLAVVKAETLDAAIAIANDSQFALTGGVYSRNPANIEKVMKEFIAGNLYINRHITGAMVVRQPFGGLKLSGVGSKAGGPDYLLQFMEPQVITENTMRRGFTPELIS